MIKSIITLSFLTVAIAVFAENNVANPVQPQTNEPVTGMTTQGAPKPAKGRNVVRNRKGKQKHKKTQPQ